MFERKRLNTKLIPKVQATRNQANGSKFERKIEEEQDEKKEKEEWEETEGGEEERKEHSVSSRYFKIAIPFRLDVWYTPILVLF
jgi:hypothetical protein